VEMTVKLGLTYWGGYPNLQFVFLPCLIRKNLAGQIITWNAIYYARVFLKWNLPHPSFRQTGLSLLGWPVVSTHPAWGGLAVFLHLTHASFSQNL
jgi:hypothetical protein